MLFQFKILIPSIAVAAALLFPAPSAAKEYPDGRKGTVEFPLGDVSFADEVVALELGEPRSGEANSQPRAALGIPNYKRTGDTSYLSLGCGGALVLRFSDNALVDVEGPDLYVFEVGPEVEATALAISADGRNWLEVGKISGGRADVDISSHAKPGDVFHYVRLTDLKASCRGKWPGADIDAVGAVGAAMQFSLNGAVLFDSGQWVLRPEAKAALDELTGKLAAYAGGRVTIEGHTDNVGSAGDNQTLSENRAKAVLDYLKAQTKLSAFSFSSKGYGETRPTASNDSDEGRAQNRRVDAVLVPGAN